MDAETHLLSVLYSHASSLGPPDVSWAFSHAKTADPVTSYINTYLQDATLLTAEELAIETHLQKTGALQKLLKAPASPSSPVKTESTLVSETEELNASTRLLRQHTQELQQQTATLSGMRSRRRAERERKRKLEVGRRRKWAAEREELQQSFDDLVGMMNEEVTDLRETVYPHAKEVEEVEKVLESDDRVFARLQRLAGELVIGEDEEMDEVVGRVEALVEKLAQLETSAVRKRLDNVFLAYDSEDGEGDTSLDALQHEIDALYADIPTVARGAAYNQFLAPLVSKISSARKQRGENWVVGGEYICAVLEHLRNRTVAMTSMLSSSHDRDTAVLTLIATISRESSTISSSSPRPTTPPPQPQPLRRLGSPVKIGRVPHLAPSHRRARSSLDFRGNYPELALLSHVGISLPPASPTRAGPMAPVINESFLSAQIAALAAKVDGAAEISTSPWSAAASEAAAAVVRVLEDALWAGNEYKEVGEMAVVRREVMAGVDEVEKGVKVVAALMGRLVGKVDEVERERGDVGGDGRKEEFVGRWRR
ncbi:hypothetical protein K440DRAFT_614488 [Wilcoxina mikolae CBS 423.85]|nr:hypothetical protein K440DRAFT_614488 [Wilcoxina mikolae CBS 423.85]